MNARVYPFIPSETSALFHFAHDEVNACEFEISKARVDMRNYGTNTDVAAEAYRVYLAMEAQAADLVSSAQVVLAHYNKLEGIK